MMAKVNYNKSQILLCFGEKPSETAISQEPKMKKARKKVFFERALNKEFIGVYRKS